MDLDFTWILTVCDEAEELGMLELYRNILKAFQANLVLTIVFILGVWLFAVMSAFVIAAHARRNCCVAALLLFLIVTVLPLFENFGHAFFTG